MTNDLIESKNISLSFVFDSFGKLTIMNNLGTQELHGLNKIADTFIKYLDSKIREFNFPTLDEHEIRKNLVKDFAKTIYPTYSLIKEYITITDLTALPTWPWKSIRKTREVVKKMTNQKKIKLFKGSNNAILVNVSDVMICLENFDLI